MDTSIQTQEFAKGILNSDNFGYDPEAGKVWIYPINYAKREYQYKIIEESLFKNTLVSLPTGLGKTFIAAVVMYNFYRWYPSSKIIFMAPTRPLVKQQIEACHNITAIPMSVIAELTGEKHFKKRKEQWSEKSIFFITPQVLQNDLDTDKTLGSKIRCLVVDEAHRARGSYAYCEVMKKLSTQNKHFRVLALSATPGNSLNVVQEIIETLLISHVEVRTRNSGDILPYVFQTSTETIVVPLGVKILQVKNDYEKILEHHTRIIISKNVISGNCRNWTKGRIFLTIKQLQAQQKQTKMKDYSSVMASLNICMTLYHAYELLILHGLRSFCSFFKEHLEKPLIRNISNLQEIVNDAQNYLGPSPNIQPLPDGTVPEIAPNIKFGHPKFYKLADILNTHFEQKGENSKVIVFCEYRESAMEIYAMLLKFRPLIKARIFLGQKSISQKQQLATMKKFCSGECNTLIATCIAEEGLDIGEVDLIVCFDISSKSPIRMVQRMGRTGRKGNGRVVFLVTEGKEEQSLKECLTEKQSLTERIYNSPQLHSKLYAENQRMIPDNVQPQCQEMTLIVEKAKEKSSTKDGNKNKKATSSSNQKRDIRDMFNAMPGKVSSKPSQSSSLDTQWEFKLFDDGTNNAIEAFDTQIYNELVSEIALFVNTVPKTNKCLTCTDFFNNFNDIPIYRNEVELEEQNWTLPDEISLTNINSTVLQNYMDVNSFTDEEDVLFNDFINNDLCFNNVSSDLNDAMQLCTNNDFKHSKDIEEDVLKFFDLSSFQDIFGKSIAEDSNCVKDLNTFFLLENFEEFFSKNEPIMKALDEVVLCSLKSEEDIFDVERLERTPINSPQRMEDALQIQSESPILGTFDKTYIKMSKANALLKTQTQNSKSNTNLSAHKPHVIDLTDSPIKLNKSLEQDESTTQMSSKEVIEIFNRNISDNEEQEMSTKKFIEDQKAIELSIMNKTQSLQSPKSIIVNKPKTKLKLATKDVSSWIKKTVPSTSIPPKTKKPSTQNKKTEEPEEESLTQVEINKILNSSLNISNSSDEFETFARSSNQTVQKSNKPKDTASRDTKLHKKRLKNDFLDLEAELDSDANVSSDEVCNDTLDSSFIDDEDNNATINSTGIHAHYLQSIKSPMKNRGTFKIPPPKVNNANVFSQVEPYSEENTYVADSFCVDTADHCLTQNNDLSELEIAEAILERNRKRKKKSSNQLGGKRKRTRIIIADSDSE